MKVLKYIGEDTNLGRFGIVKKNQTLTMSEREFASINGDKRFVFKGTRRTEFNPKNTTNESVAAKAVRKDQVKNHKGKTEFKSKPAETKSYDLTKINWSDRRLAYALDAKSKRDVQRIAKALGETGVEVESTNRLKKRRIVDNIIEASIREGWRK